MAKKKTVKKVEAVEAVETRGKGEARRGGSTTRPTSARSSKTAKVRAHGRAPKRSTGAGNGTAVRPGDALVIVESPTKARTIGKYLGRGYSVKATVGHLRDLPTRKLGVEIDEKGRSFQPEYVTIKGKTQTL
ncbi:MAG TPA: toprim domain-containing protein, partial [Gemmatimonadales bacterium]|nr:toprim domain-containing protein [Gemmatimonadales bacterium]